MNIFECQIDLLKVQDNLLGGFVVFYLYDLVFGIEFKEYLSLLLALSIPSIVLGVFRSYFQQFLFALEDNYVLVVSLASTGLVIVSTRGLVLLGLDAGVSVVLGINLANLASTLLSYRRLRGRYKVRFR